MEKKSITLIVVLALVFGLIGGMISSELRPSAGKDRSDQGVVQPVQMKLVNEESDVISAIENVSPSVVSIVISQELKTIRRQGMSPFDLFFNDNPQFEQFFDQPSPNQPQVLPEVPQEEADPVFQKVGGGSGFIIDAKGLVMTNRHVVSRDDVEYTVILNDGTEFSADVVSRDFFNDIAVIQLKPEDGATLPTLQPVTFGNSANLSIGQSVIAIGNALAEFQNSATKGIVSAIGRQIVASDGSGRGENLLGLIQTDAAINPGNSGGPLINLAGEVVGVNTAIAQGANNIGFAIPIDEVKIIVKSVIENGRIIRPILGVMFTMLTPELAKELGIETEDGALLRGDGQNFAVLPGKPAEKAGLLEKDIIIEVNDVKIDQDHPLQQEIMKYNPGDTIVVKYLRQGEEKETQVMLEEANLEEIRGE
ncbi:MAG: trypsin-like peptidase domain-containing protein [bacterium]|nr:trypsin-like peptidase domain-containing protein [bacterium]